MVEQAGEFVAFEAGGALRRPVRFLAGFELREGLPAVIALVTLGQVCRFAVRRRWLASGRRERAVVRG